MGLDMGLSINGGDNGYWRKANQVREWFATHLENFNDDGDTPVKKQDLVDLLEVCQEVLANHNLAPELLPTSEGFFFGSQEYDEYYFGDLEDTVDILESVIEGADWDSDTVVYWESY